MTFRDHHPFTSRDVERIVAAAGSVSASVVLTTEKDAVRLAPHVGGQDAAQKAGSAMPFAFVPLHVTVEPAAEFKQWLTGRLR
jgi:tetraacyldisaccharide-1-P 4'-kinase